MPTDLENEEDLRDLFEGLLETDGSEITFFDVQGKWMGYDNVAAKELTTEDGDELVVFQNEDDARKAAVDYVKADLETAPETYEQTFVERHINQEKLKEWVKDAVREMATEDVREMSDEQFWEEVERRLDEEVLIQAGLIKVGEYGSGEPSNRLRDELIEVMVDDRASEDPMEFFRESYSREDAPKEAIKVAGIDYDAAAEEAISLDGPGHFLGHWDNALYHVPGDTIVYVFLNRHFGKKPTASGGKGRKPSKYMGPL